MIQNQTLYEKVKEEANTRYKKPSAYKSGWIVKTYKDRGGTYAGKKPKTGLTRWYKESWQDVGGKDYPVYRPTIRVTKDTPLTVQEVDPRNLKKQIALKQRYRGVKNLPRFEHKNSPYSIMPKHGKGKHGMGFLDDLKEFGLSAAKDVGRELIPIAKDYAISAAKSALTKKTGKGMGEGLYATPSRGSGFKLSAAQARALGVGKGVQLKKEMMGGEYEMKMTPAMEKKMMKAFAKGKGMRVSSKNLMELKKGGFIVPMLMTAARIAAPILIEKLAEAGIKKLGGGMCKCDGVCGCKKGRGKGDVLDNTKFMARLAMGKTKGGDMKLFSDKSPIGMAFKAVGAGQQGMGLFAGGGMNDPDGVVSEVIQTGSPYQSTSSPAMTPFVQTKNPFGMYAPL